MTHPRMSGWWIASSCCDDLPLPNEHLARELFEQMRNRARKHGGDGELIHDGETVDRFEHFAENE